MRNMIFKTLFASILGLFLVAPLAHADRQGGGTLKVALNVIDPRAADWVLFKGIDGDRVTFDYSRFEGASQTLNQFSLTKSDLMAQAPELVGALLQSKSGADWVQLK